MRVSLLCEADVILALDWVDLGGALRQARNVGNVTAKIIACSLDQTLHTGANMEYQALPTVDVAMASTADVVVAELNDASRQRPQEPVEGKSAGESQNREWRRDQHGAGRLGAARSVQRSGECDILHARPRLAVRHLAVTERHGVSRQRWRRRTGLRARAFRSARRSRLQNQGRYAVSMLGDGDFCMGATAIWSAAHHRIPLLVLVNNNRSYFNDELHQENVARTRGREVKNRWIGLRLEDPMPNIAKLAEAQGAVGIGPVTKAVRCQSGDRAGRRRAQEGRRLRDRPARRSADGASGKPQPRSSRDGSVASICLIRPRDSVSIGPLIDVLAVLRVFRPDLVGHLRAFGQISRRALLQAKRCCGVAAVHRVRRSAGAAVHLVVRAIGHESKSPAASRVIVLSGILYMSAMLLYLQALQSEEASVVAPFFQTSPLFGYVLAYLVLGETLSARQLAGGAMIVVGALLVSIRFAPLHSADAAAGRGDRRFKAAAGDPDAGLRLCAGVERAHLQDFRDRS